MIKRIRFPIFREIIKNLQQRPFTIKYPTEHSNVPEKYRGAPEVDPKLCIVCKACEKECPTHCIRIIPVKSEEITTDSHERENVFWFTINLCQCMFCQQCEEICPVGKKSRPAISLNSKRWRLATYLMNKRIEKKLVYKKKNKGELLH